MLFRRGPARKVCQTLTPPQKPGVQEPATSPSLRHHAYHVPAPVSVSWLRSLLHLDALVGPVVLEHDVNSFDDFFAGIGLAMDNDLVLQRLRTINLHHVFLGEAVVPTAIPNGQIVCVFLKRVRQLSAG